jgi:hypothetical protein
MDFLLHSFSVPTLLPIGYTFRDSCDGELLSHITASTNLSPPPQKGLMLYTPLVFYFVSNLVGDKGVRDFFAMMV